MRSAMHISTMAPSPGRLKLLGQLVLNPLTRWIALARWYYGNSGEHNGNHYSTGGLQLGQRYDFSNIVVGGNKQTSPPEDPICVYIPKIVAGGRLLHVSFDDGSIANDFVAIENYTLFQVSQKHGNTANDLATAFMSLGAKLEVVDVSDKLENHLKAGKRNTEVAAIWKTFSHIIVRPDLYVAWTLAKNESWDPQMADPIANQLLAFSEPFAQIEQAKSMTHWLTQRMVQVLEPMRFTFPKGVFVINKEREAAQETKGEVFSIDGQEHLYQKARERQLDGKKKEKEEEEARGDVNFGNYFVESVPLDENTLRRKESSRIWENYCSHVEDSFDEFLEV